MRSEQPVRCAKCYLPMEAYEMRTVRKKAIYHQHCFLQLAREESQREKAQAAATELDSVAQDLLA
jgi:hypothetical protein